MVLQSTDFYNVYTAFYNCFFATIVAVKSQVYLTVAAVWMKRVVALDILFKPRPAETERRREKRKSLSKLKNKTSPPSHVGCCGLQLPGQLIDDVDPDKELRQL